MVSTKEIYEHELRKLRESDADVADVPFEEMKAFIEGKRYEIEFSPSGNLHIELAAIDSILPILGERTWSLLVAPEGGPEFICCDHPVTLVRKDGRQIPAGLATRGTEVFVPLARTIGILGMFEDFLQPVVRLNPEGVAAMNARVEHHAVRHFYSASPRFVLKRNGEICTFECQIGSSPRR